MSQKGLDDVLWNEDDTDTFSNESFQQLLMEQYKLYVEMTDRISARRSLTNTFFLTLHALIVGVLGLSLSRSPFIPQIGLLLVPLLGLLILCYAWWRLVQWYRHLILVRQKVIGELEQRLPSSPSLLAEKQILQQAGYFNPLSRMEKLLPFVFAALYILCFFYISHIS